MFVVSSFDPHAPPPSYEEATVLDLFEHLHPTAPPLHSWYCEHKMKVVLYNWDEKISKS